MKKMIFVFTLAILSTSFFSCEESANPREQSVLLTKQDTIILKDQVAVFAYKNILLGDGVPLSVDLNVRWKVTDAELIFSQFNTEAEFRDQVLKPRGQEIVGQVFNGFESVDSVFTTQRQLFVSRIKESIYDHLGESGILIKEVICSQIHFPSTYTAAMEQAGLQRQELERINQQNLIAIAQADAERKKAEADAKVQIARAKAEDQVEKIKADTEKNRRESMLATAETQKQIAMKQAQSDAERKKLLAKADLEKNRDLKKLEIEHKRNLVDVEVEKKKKMDVADFEVQMELANVFQNNPVYASYLVNKELASKVQIAVLPTGSDPNVFGGLLQQTIPVDNKNN